MEISELRLECLKLAVANGPGRTRISQEHEAQAFFDWVTQGADPVTLTNNLTPAKDPEQSPEETITIDHERLIRAALPFGAIFDFQFEWHGDTIYFQWQEKRFKYYTTNNAVWECNGSTLTGTGIAALIQRVIELTAKTSPEFQHQDSPPAVEKSEV